ncbi:MAG: rod shape-determining protein MreD [Clostridia bacterium]
MFKKIITMLKLVLLIVIIYLFQIFVVDGRTLFGVKPNFILICVIVVSLWYGMYCGSFFAFCIGVLTDLIFINSMGVYTIAYTIVGLIVGFLNTKYIKENKMSLVYTTLIATAIFEICQYFLYLFTMGVSVNILYLIKQIILASLLNIVCVYIFYGMVKRIISYFDLRLNVKNLEF